MKIFVIAFAVIATAVAASVSTEYLPPVHETALPTQEYLPPVNSAALPTQEYLPPVSALSAGEPTVLANDGYRYKTVRRFRIRRRRRDVNELPSNDYLPPVNAAPLPTQEYLPPVSSVPEQHTVLADDGYRYRTVKRFRIRRRRRDVNELPSNDYLPPVNAAPLPTQEYLPPVSSAPEQHTVLADDGYRYRTVKRFRIRRRRRDVNEPPSNDYLPPVNAATLPTQEYLPPVSSAPEQHTVLADDGYRYRTVKRFRIRRRRRDVNELPLNEYLPPIQEASLVADEPTVFADDGYRYRTVKHYRLRRRRDVSDFL